MLEAKIIEFDLDGTLTVDNDWNPREGDRLYRRREPNYNNIELVRKAVEQGWTVVINTARKEHNRTVTVNWLAKHGVPYHFLFMGKLPCTYRIDDVNITPEAFDALLNRNGTKEETKT